MKNMPNSQKSFNFMDDKFNYNSFEPLKVYNRIKKQKWKDSPFKAQNWGIWLHHMGAYVGKIKPAMAHFLIRSCTKPNQVIFDPFCGIGTIPLEGDLLGRKVIGNDLNPYAFFISKAKFHRDSKKKILDRIDKLNLNNDRISLDNCSDFMLKFYHPDTLKEILSAIKILKRKKDYFLLGCLLGIIHGHRPGHLSAVTSLVIPYLPRTKPIYKEVKSRLVAKVERMFKNDFSERTDGIILNENSKKLSLKNNSVDAVISSPPYFNTLDYSADNKLRNEFLGINELKRKKLKQTLIQQNKTYIEEMLEVGLEIKRVLKKGAYCIFVLGDLHSGKKIINTAKEISEAYKALGFITHGVIDDAMPVNKAIPNSHKRNKLDRILVMTNGKYKKI